MPLFGPDALIARGALIKKRCAQLDSVYTPDTRAGNAVHRVSAAFLLGLSGRGASVRAASHRLYRRRGGAHRDC